MSKANRLKTGTWFIGGSGEPSIKMGHRFLGFLSLWRLVYSKVCRSCAKKAAVEENSTSLTTFSALHANGWNGFLQWLLGFTATPSTTRDLSWLGPTPATKRLKLPKPSCFSSPALPTAWLQRNDEGGRADLAHGTFGFAVLGALGSAKLAFRCSIYLTIVSDTSWTTIS